MNIPTLRALQKSLAEARRCRKRMWVGETHVWSYLERLTEPAGYQGLLFAGAAGAQPKIVKWALEHGANATEPLGYEWPAVEEGQFRQIPAFGPAFVWRTNAKETRSGALVYVPMEAAICGACSDCRQLLTGHGANFEAGLKWFVGLPFTIPRLESGAMLLAAVEVEKPAYWLPLRDWLSGAQRWLNARRRPADPMLWTRILKLHRLLLKLCPSYELIHRPPDGVTAEIL